MIHLVDVRTSTTTVPTTDAIAATNDNIGVVLSKQLLKWYQYGYLQDASSSGYGGNYEGLGTVYSVLPGVAMLASSPPSSFRSIYSAQTFSFLPTLPFPSKTSFSFSNPTSLPSLSSLLIPLSPIPLSHLFPPFLPLPFTLILSHIPPCS